MNQNAAPTFYHTIIKPTGAQCNLDCAYCFYLHKEDLLAQPKTPRMSLETLEAHIKQYIESQSGPEVIFTWQGGEPTLMGLDFFEKAVALQKKYKLPFQRVENDLQTNGVLLDDKWCEFLKRNNFLVGISIDGPKAFHDIYRTAKGGQPSFDKVLSAVKLLKKHGITFNALCVVNDVNSQKPLETYRFLRDEIAPRIIQFIPAVEPTWFEAKATTKDHKDDRAVTEWSVKAKDWGNFLNVIFDEWFQHDFGKTFVDQFENVVSILYDRGAQMCVNAPKCGQGLAIEFNGDLYSCDHFVYPEHRLGNIHTSNQGELARSHRQKDFGDNKLNTLTSDCKSCPFLKYCWGDCPKNRFINAPSGEYGQSYLCEGLKLFYGHFTKNAEKIQKRIGKL